MMIAGVVVGDTESDEELPACTAESPNLIIDSAIEWQSDAVVPCSGLISPGIQ